MSQAKQTAEKVDYNGADNLAMMSHAINYNSGLYNWVARDIRPGEAILDFGAGNGEYANRFPIGSVDAAEIDPELLPFIKQPIYTDISQLPKQYDLIYTINVLEHIEHHGEIVKSCSQNSSPVVASRYLYQPGRKFSVIWTNTLGITDATTKSWFAKFWKMLALK